MNATTQTRYDSSTDRKWQCLVCHKFVDAEMHEREIEPTAPRQPQRTYRRSPVSGKIVEKWFTPVSRYWNEKGVFCSAECGCEYTRAGGAAF